MVGGDGFEPPTFPV